MSGGIFVDASALVAITNRESDAERFLAAIESADRRVTSSLAVFETWLAIQLKRPGAELSARDDLALWLSDLSFEIVPIDSALTGLAMTAHLQFGKGRGHPARLNMGDCFAYAAARHLDLPLLYKGDDFALTDVASALS